MSNTRAGAGFRIIQLLLLPIAIVGYILFVVRLIFYSRRSGISATVLASFYTRWMQHALGTRPDDTCARLMKVLPNVSRLGLSLVTAPTRVAHRLTGYVPAIYRYPYEGVPPMFHQSAARTTFYDEALQRYFRGIDQLVILGAGLDTRLYRMRPEARVRCFEIDKPQNQAFKREMLKLAAVDQGRVVYVPADFQAGDWVAKLVKAGFDPDRPGFFLWESVTMYLDRDAVTDTLRKISRMAAGSVVAFDYFSSEMMQSRSIFMRYTRAVLNFMGEPFGTFGIDNTSPARERADSFLKSCGLKLLEQRNFGQESERQRALAGFAIAIRSA